MFSSLFSNQSSESRVAVRNGYNQTQQDGSRSNQIRKAKSNHESPFAYWTTQALARRLQMDGVDLPADVTPHDLIAIADEFYADRELPEPPEDDNVQYVDRQGFEYVLRPAGYDRLRIDTIPEDQYFDGYLYCENDSYLPPMSRADYQASMSNINANNASVPNQERLRLLQSGKNSYEQMPQNVGDDGEQYGDDDDGGYWLGPGDHGSSFKIIHKKTQHHIDHPEEVMNQYEFMHEGDEFRIESEFQPPSVETAEYYADLNHPRDKNGKPYSVWKTKTGRHCHGRGACWKFFDPFCEGAASDLARYGQGVSLYFKFLKWGFWTFFILTLIATPQMIINAGVDGPQSVAVGYLSVTTLGNLAESVYGINNTVSLGVNATEVNATVVRGSSVADVTIPIFGRKIPRDILGRWYTASDILAVVVFFLSIQWLKHFEAQEHLRVAKKHISVEEYTIQVLRVPPDITEWDLAKFFGDLTQEPVADVYLAQDNGDLINLYVKRGKIIDKLWKAASRVHLLKNERKENPKGRVIMSDNYLDSELGQAIKAYDKLFAKYQKMTELRNKSKHTHSAVSAFVTFETQAGFLKCLDLYPAGRYARLTQPENQRLKGMRIRVRQAPPPSTIKWENMGVKWNERMTRRSFSIFLTLVFLGCSFIASYTAVRYRQDLSSKLSSTCELPSNSTYIDGILDIIRNGNQKDVKALNSDDKATLTCLCQTLDYKETTLAIVDPRHACHSFWNNQSLLYGYTFAATLVVAVVNQIIENLIQFLSQFEKHHALVNMELSVVKRTFLALFLNTAGVILLVNADFGESIIGRGNYKDFTPDWYSNVASQITLTMIFNVFTMHLYRTGYMLYFHCRKRHQNAYSQRELNEVYLGPVFHLALRTAQIVSIVFVTMLYSAGIPALYPIAAGAFLLFYCIDKYLILRLYRTPPNYSNKLSQWVSSILWWANILHMCFAAWMYSANGFFTASFSVGSEVATGLGSVFGINVTLSQKGDFDFERRMTLDHIIPYFLLIVFSLIYKAITVFFVEADNIIRSWCCCLNTCGFISGATKRRYLNPNFTDARMNGEIRGLDTYNILQNPIYARSFGINDAFAGQHRHVGSVRLLSKDQVPDLETALTPENRQQSPEV